MSVPRAPVHYLMFAVTVLVEVRIYSLESLYTIELTSK